MEEAEVFNVYRNAHCDGGRRRVESKDGEEKSKDLSM